MDRAMTRGEAELAFNVAHRIVGSPGVALEAAEEALRAVAGRQAEDGDAALFAATSQACHRLVPKRPRVETVQASAGSEDAIAAASMGLPVRQREALALDELGKLSYTQIATIMEIGDGAVAQLISRARINLSDELRGTVVASIAAPSPACERALPLIARREDGQLGGSSNDAAWLDVHLADCERCRLAVKATREATDAYRAWALLPAPASLFGATEASAAAAEPDPAASAAAQRGRRSRWAALASALGALLLVGFGVALFGDDPAAPPLDQAADAAPHGAAASPSVKDERRKAQKATGKRDGTTSDGGSSSAPATGGEATPAPVTVTSSGRGSQSSDSAEPGRSSGEAAVEPTEPASAPRSGAKPRPAPTAASTSQPSAEPAPASVDEEAPPAEEDGPGSGKEPPGKAVGRPPK